MQKRHFVTGLPDRAGTDLSSAVWLVTLLYPECPSLKQPQRLQLCEHSAERQLITLASTVLSSSRPLA